MSSYSELQTKLQAIIDEDEYNFCWMCGRDNIAVKDALTKHHVINQKYLSEMHITIPICKNCSVLLHKDEEFFSLLRRLLWK